MGAPQAAQGCAREGAKRSSQGLTWHPFTEGDLDPQTLMLELLSLLHV